MSRETCLCRRLLLFPSYTLHAGPALLLFCLLAPPFSQMAALDAERAQNQKLQDDLLAMQESPRLPLVALKDILPMDIVLGGDGDAASGTRATGVVVNPSPYYHHAP